MCNHLMELGDGLARFPNAADGEARQLAAVERSPEGADLLLNVCVPDDMAGGAAANTQKLEKKIVYIASFSLLRDPSSCTWPQSVL